MALGDSELRSLKFSRLFCPPGPVIPAASPLTSSDGSDTSSQGCQRPAPAACLDWWVPRCPQSPSVLTKGWRGELCRLRAPVRKPSPGEAARRLGRSRSKRQVQAGRRHAGHNSSCWHADPPRGRPCSRSTGHTGAGVGQQSPGRPSRGPPKCILPRSPLASPHLR